MNLAAIWSDERTSRLKVLYEAGLSASQIAADLGGVTRDAVIGKIHRLDLQLRGKIFKRDNKPRPRPAKIRKAAQNIFATRWGASDANIKPPSPINFVDIVLDPLNISFADIHDGQCKSITNDDMSAPLYCGRFAAPGINYCEPHRRLYYHPGKRQAVREPSLVPA